jgi:hypothetical protein
MATAERRKDDSVVFERGFDAHIMAIDGTWRRACIMTEASESGAKLTIIKSVEGLNLTEFFLLLSTTGLAYRRCELAWVNGDQGQFPSAWKEEENTTSSTKQRRPSAIGRARALTPPACGLDWVLHSISADKPARAFGASGTKLREWSSR